MKIFFDISLPTQAYILALLLRIFFKRKKEREVKSRKASSIPHMHTASTEERRKKSRYQIILLFCLLLTSHRIGFTCDSIASPFHLRLLLLFWNILCFWLFLKQFQKLFRGWAQRENQATHHFKGNFTHISNFLVICQYQKNFFLSAL